MSHRPSIDIPDVPFFLFGLGCRRKLLYRQGTLLDAASGTVLRQWPLASEQITPADYSVSLQTRDGNTVTITEDEQAVWLKERHSRSALTEGPVALPVFAGHPKANLLRILHQEILVNIVNGHPLPNLFVYDKPWYRDAAMMCMCLQKTGNLDFVRNWVLSLEELYDCNNAGHREPDNLGQLLYMLSLFTDKQHRLVARILKEIPRVTEGRHIVGLTDGNEHPVYQTKWLKFGLRSLGLADTHEIPAVYDSYSALFWWDYREQHVEGDPFQARARALYPYLGWAEDHFHGNVPDFTLAGPSYPLTWEAHASEGVYENMQIVNEQFLHQRLAMPHTWHAAEMFLRLLEQTARSRPSDFNTSSLDT